MTASNISSIALGVNEVREGEAITSSGVVHMAEGIVEAWDKPMRWAYGEGDSEVHGFFTLADMYKEVRNAKGEADSRALTAKYDAVATEHGVVDGFTSGDKIQFKRAWQIASAGMLGAGIRFNTIQVVKGSGKNKVVTTQRSFRAPAGAVLELYNADGTPTKAGKDIEQRAMQSFDERGETPSPEELVAAAKAFMVQCNGGKLGEIKLPSVTTTSTKLAAFAVNAGLMKEGPSRNRNKDGNDEGRQFSESLAFVHKSLDLILDPESEESNFAPSPAIDESLHRLQGKLALYFTAMQAGLKF